jgi:hypothetical protein
MKSRTPIVGQGASYGYGADSYPATVAKVSASGKTVWIRDDKFKRIKGSFMTGDAEFLYYDDPDAPLQKATLRKNGRYYFKGCSMRHGGSVYFGTRRYYQDPHF